MKRYQLNLTMNTRDLGGYSTCYGKNTLFMKFIRSDALRYITEEDKQFLLDNNFKISIDLRTENVVSRFPSSLQDDNRFIYYNIPLKEGSGIPLNDENASELYFMMIHHIDSFNQIFTIICEAKENIIFNCTAGKDRTGILACLLLLVAGVSKEDIIKNYLKSEENIYSSIGKLCEFNPSFPKDLGHVKRKYIETFLDMFEEKYQKVDNYLLSIGLSEIQIDTIRKKLIGE